MNFSIKNYYMPTPAIMRKIGDGLFSASAFITGYAGFCQNEKAILASLIFGVVGKFLTNCFAEVKDEVKKDV